MTRNKIIGISIIIVSILAIVGIYFFFQDNKKVDTPVVSNDNTTVANNTFEELNETEPKYFDNFGVGKLKIETFGGPKDIKTSIKNGVEYALFRNPENIGGLEFVLSNEMGNYYFAENLTGEKIIFEKGTAEGDYGYEKTLVSERFIGDLNTQTEYYSAYPQKNIALKIGIQAIEDTGAGNRFLNSKYLKITNLNNNVSVITTIETRSEKEGSLLVSEATRKALKVDEGVLGSFNLEIVDKENNNLGIVR